MSGAVLGSIEIQMLADLARLRQDMTEAKNVVGNAMSGISSSVKGAFAGLAAGLSVAAFTAMVKGALDAAEALKDLSIQTGASVESLSAMAAIGVTTGTSAEAIGGAMNKLAKNLAGATEDSKGAGAALEALGLDLASLRNMKPEDQMVALAGAMNKFEDGSGKSAVAMTLLGKEGAKLLPYMADLANAGQLVATVTTEQANAADEYNDAVAKSGLKIDSFKRQLAFELLPVMSAVHEMTGSLGQQIGEYLAGSAKEAGDSFGAMNGVIRVVGTVLEALVVLGSDVAFVFKGIGTEIGGIAAQAAAFFSGDFAAVGAIQKAMTEDAERARTELDKFQASVLGTTDRIIAGRDAMHSNSLSAAENKNEMQRLENQYGKSEKATLKFNAAAKEQKDNTEKLAKAGRDYMLQVDAGYASLQRSLSLGRELTEGEKEQAKLTLQLAEGKIKLTAEEERATRAKIDASQAAREQIAHEKEHLELLIKIAQHSAGLAGKQVEQTASMRDTNVALREQNEALSLSKDQILARDQAILIAKADELEWQAAFEGGNWQLAEQARLLRERAGLLGNKAALEDAKATADEWKKTTDSIGQGLTDSLFRAFESGRGFFSTLWDGIKNLFKTTVLKLAIAPVQTAITAGVNAAGNYVQSAVPSALGSLTGTGAAAWAGQGGLATLSAAGNYGAVYSGTAYGTGFGTQQSAMLAAQEAGMTSTAGASAMGSAATYAGYAALVYAAYKQGESDYAKGHTSGQAQTGEQDLFGSTGANISPLTWKYDLFRKLGLSDKQASIWSGGTMVARGMSDLGLVATNHQGSVVGVDAAGQFSTKYGDSSRITDNFNQSIDDALRLLTGMSTKLVRDMGAAFGKDSAITALAKFAADGKDSSIGQFFLSMNGQQAGYVGNGADFAKYNKDGATGLNEFIDDVAYATRSALLKADIPKWASEALSKLTEESSFKDLQDAVSEIAAFQGALVALQTDLTPLGGVFERIGGLSSDAMKELTDFAGGIQQFADKAAAFVSTYYSASEKAGLGAKGVLEQLASLGITDAGGMSSLADMRALVEAQQINDTQGRAQLNSLLDIAANFASVGQYLEQNNLTLSALAEQAPQVAALEAIKTPTQVTADSTARTADATETQITLLQSLQTSVESGLAQVAEATNKLTSLMREWDGGGAMTVVVEA